MTMETTWSKDLSPSLACTFVSAHSVHVQALIFAVAGSLIAKRKADRRTAPSGLRLQCRITDAEAIYVAVTNCMQDCPSALRPGVTSDNALLVVDVCPKN